MLGDSGNKESPFELLILIICDLSTGENFVKESTLQVLDILKIAGLYLQIELEVILDHFWVSK